jgi:hypothetical protein
MWEQLQTYLQDHSPVEMQGQQVMQALGGPSVITETMVMAVLQAVLAILAITAVVVTLEG